MKAETHILALCIALGLLWGCADGPGYRVVGVTDGDTLTVEDGEGVRTRVRLRRIDAPERGEPGWAEAKADLEARLLGRRVRVTSYAHDRYGRLVAEVEAE